jgi:MFS family permease
MQQFTEYLRRFAHFQRDTRLYLLQSALVGIGIGIFSLLYPLYLSALGYKTDLIGLVLFFIPLGTSAAIIPAGLCVDRFSGKAILIWSSVVMVIAVMGQILFRDLVPLCICAFGIGIGISFQYVLNAPFLTTNSTPDERAHVFSLNIVLILVTTVLGELLGGALPVWLREYPWAMFPQFSWFLAEQQLARSYQITILCGLLLALTSFIPLFLMTNRRPPYIVSEQQPFAFVLLSPRELLLTFQKKFKKDTQTRRDVIDGGTPLSFWSRLRLFLLSPLVIMGIHMVLIGFGTGIVTPYFGLFFVQHLGANSALFGIIDGSSNAILAFATLLAPLMVIRIGRLKTIVYTSLLSIPVILYFGSFSLLLLAAILYPLFQVLWNMANGIVQLFSMEVVPAKFQGRANSSYQIEFQIASTVATPIGGLLIARLGYTPVFWMTAGFFFLPVVLIWWRFGSKRFVLPGASSTAMGEGQREERKVTISPEDTERGQNNEETVISPKPL